VIAPDFATVERLAIKLCEQSRGAGHWERHKTKRQHWRDKAMAILAEQQEAKRTVYAGVKDSLANIMGGRW